MTVKKVMLSGLELIPDDILVIALELNRNVYNSRYEAAAEIMGSFDARAKKFTADWEFTGMLPSDIKVWRAPIGKEDDAEVVSTDNTLGHFEDLTIEGSVPGYEYWVSYKADGVEHNTDKVSFEWGLPCDTSLASLPAGIYVVSGKKVFVC